VYVFEKAISSETKLIRQSGTEEEKRKSKKKEYFLCFFFYFLFFISSPSVNSETLYEL